MTPVVPCSERFPLSCGWNILKQVVGIEDAAAQTSGPPESPKAVVCLHFHWEEWGLLRLLKVCCATITPISSLFRAEGMPALASLPPSDQGERSQAPSSVRSLCPHKAPVWEPRGCQCVGSPHGFSAVQTPSQWRAWTCPGEGTPGKSLHINRPAGGDTLGVLIGVAPQGPSRVMS